MLPQEVLSSEPVPAQFRYPRNVPRAPLIDYEYGGLALQDASRGINCNRPSKLAASKR